MSKTALLFPGQASQYVGMGKDLYESSDAVRALYSLASEEIGTDIAAISFEGPAEQLKRTRFTQPAILLHALSILTVLGDRLPVFHYACGHSLGEYAALAVTGAMSYQDAIRAVVKRASLMEDACQANPGTMAAIMGLDSAQVEDICRLASEKGVVIPANFNSAIQIAISGAVPSVEQAVVLAKEAKAKRAVMLEVGGAFHSPLMEPAKVGLAQFLDQLTIANPSVPVVANVTASSVMTGDDIRRLLVEQVTEPVRWSQTMNYLVNNGVTSIIEIGPGKVLSGLAKRDMKPDSIVNLDTCQDIENFTTGKA
ncbi:MAG: ACP S-malonyltransferase [Candidatus Zixiibacteriota bacterium]|nr:MAG: ACP S-malonyltransferase [candidate division Zixibacteria bacterium]